MDSNHTGHECGATCNLRAPCMPFPTLLTYHMTACRRMSAFACVPLKRAAYRSLPLLVQLGAARDDSLGSCSCRCSLFWFLNFSEDSAWSSIPGNFHSLLSNGRTRVTSVLPLARFSVQCYCAVYSCLIGPGHYCSEMFVSIHISSKSLTARRLAIAFVYSPLQLFFFFNYCISLCNPN